MTEKERIAWEQLRSYLVSQCVNGVPNAIADLLGEDEPQPDYPPKGTIAWCWDHDSPDKTICIALGDGRWERWEGDIHPVEWDNYEPIRTYADGRRDVLGKVSAFFDRVPAANTTGSAIYSWVLAELANMETTP